jgi:hypothetical protein
LKKCDDVFQLQPAPSHPSSAVVALHESLFSLFNKPRLNRMFVRGRRRNLGSAPSMVIRLVSKFIPLEVGSAVAPVVVAMCLMPPPFTSPLFVGWNANPLPLW